MSLIIVNTNLLYLPSNIGTTECVASNSTTDQIERHIRNIFGYTFLPSINCDNITNPIKHRYKRRNSNYKTTLGFSGLSERTVSFI